DGVEAALVLHFAQGSRVELGADFIVDAVPLGPRGDVKDQTCLDQLRKVVKVHNGDVGSEAPGDRRKKLLFVVAAGIAQLHLDVGIFGLKGVDHHLVNLIAPGVAPDHKLNGPAELRVDLGRCRSDRKRYQAHKQNEPLGRFAHVVSSFRSCSGSSLVGEKQGQDAYKER